MTKNPSAATTLWNDVVKQRVRQDRHLNFWASSLPFCPRAFWLDAKFGPFFDEHTYSRDVPLTFGTAVHTHIQKWLGTTSQLWGDWTCPRCDYSKHDTFKPTTNCRTHTYFDLNYQEKRVTYEEFTGKVDAIVQLRTDNRWVVIEFKTESPSRWQRRTKPETSHLDQSNSYACLLQQPPYQLPIDEFWIWYFDRNDITKRPNMWSYTPRPQRWKKIVALMRKIRQSISNDPQPPKRRCYSNKQQPWCKVKELCWNEHLFNRLMNERTQHDDRS